MNNLEDKIKEALRIELQKESEKLIEKSLAETERGLKDLADKIQHNIVQAIKVSTEQSPTSPNITIHISLNSLK